jgi:hypothetical protein
MFYCFNENCNLWGEPVTGIGFNLTWPFRPMGGPCVECGHNVIWHDNWLADQRQHDDGTPVTER